MANNARYDEEYVTLGQVKEALQGNTDALNASITSEVKSLTNTISSASSVFTSQPKPSYKRGDLWINGSTTYVCTNDRKTGTYVSSDWKILTDKDNVIGQINASGGGVNGSKISDGTIGDGKISGVGAGKLSGTVSVNVNNGSVQTNSATIKSGGTLYLLKNDGSYSCIIEPSNIKNMDTQGGHIHGDALCIRSERALNLFTGAASPTQYGATNCGIYIKTKTNSHTYTGQANITLDASDGTGYVYAEGYGTGKGRVAKDESGPSSKCLKKDIIEFTDYDEALSLLKDLKLYDYNYKYNMGTRNNQYGFIIDDLLNDKRAEKFFYFKDEKAGIMENNCLDYAAPYEEDNNLEIIEFKRYDVEMLTKYLLVCNKALQDKIDKLEKEVKQLKEEKKDV